MTPQFRPARREDVAAVVALLRDDPLGQTRETKDLDRYLAAFDAMAHTPDNQLIVGQFQEQIVACYQLTFIWGLTLNASRRAQIEGVRVLATLRGQGLGQKLIEDAETRARQAGCQLLQFTTYKARNDAHRFYERLGFTPSHIGYKKPI